MDWRCSNQLYHFLFLLEASGDSEGNPNSLENAEASLCYSVCNLMWMNFLDGLPLAGDQDDAESSSHDDSSCVQMIDSNELRESDCRDSSDAVVNYDPEEVIEESRLGTFVERIGTEVEHETEGDRLFWETCLAAGFP